jgi:hypothetical protein
VPQPLLDFVLLLALVLVLVLVIVLVIVIVTRKRSALNISGGNVNGTSSDLA